MKITLEDQYAISQISLLSGLDENKVQDVFKSFVILFTLDYQKNKSVHIPFVGNFLVRFLRDIVTPEGKEAELNSFFSPSDELKRVIGQLKDIEDHGNSMDLDTYKIMKQILNKDFKLSLEKETLK